MKIHLRLPCIFAMLIFAIVTCLACTKDKTKSAIINTAPDTTSSANDTTPAVVKYKYLALGDSYTIGESVAEQQRFPAQTSQLLYAQNIALIPIQYIATTGWTTINLANAITAQNPASDFDVVTLLIGVNDQYQHLDTAGYRSHFTQLLHQAVGFAGNRSSRVFVLSIPDYSVTPFVAASEKARVAMEVAEFNAINKEVTLANHIAYIDITPSTQQGASDPSLIAGDGLHPSAKEYAKWAAMLAPLIKNAL